MTREELVLPSAILTSSPTGVLGTTEKVRQAREELEAAVLPSFEEFQRAHCRALIEAAKHHFG